MCNTLRDFQKSIPQSLDSEIKRISSIIDVEKQSEEKVELLNLIECLYEASSSIKVILNSVRREAQAIRVVPREEKIIYIDGFKTGLGWREDYRPGGPYVHASAQSTLNHKAWMKGFDEGKLAQAPILEKLQQELGLKVE